MVVPENVNKQMVTLVSNDPEGASYLEQATYGSFMSEPFTIYLWKWFL
jgi:hypothetical protein